MAHARPPKTRWLLATGGALCLLVAPGAPAASAGGARTDPAAVSAERCQLHTMPTLDVAPQVVQAFAQGAPYLLVCDGADGTSSRTVVLDVAP